MAVQTAHGQGLAHDSEDPPGSYLRRPWGTTTVTQLKLSCSKDLKRTQHFPASIQEFVDDADHAQEKEIQP